MKIQEFLKYFKKVKQSGEGYSALCPAHDDRNPSLSISEKDDKILVKCFAGCTAQEIVEAVGLSINNLFLEEVERNSRSINEDADFEWDNKEPVARYEYHDEQGNLLYESVRFLPKDFRVRRPKPDMSGYIWNLNGVTLVLYNLPRIRKAIEVGLPVFVVEGEKDADNLQKFLGDSTAVTTNVFGAGKWKDEYSESLRGAEVVILPDNDPPGQEHAEEVAQSVSKTAKSVKVVSLPGLLEKGDISDSIAQGHTVEELWGIVNAAPPFQHSEYLNRTKEQKKNPWQAIKPVSVFLAEKDEDFEGLAKDLLMPGHITLLSAPRGVGKTQVSYALGVALATGGTFLGEKVKRLRVLLVERDNPEHYVKESLRKWNAEQAVDLYILTRQYAPDLKDKQAWNTFPVEQYDVVIFDSVGSATEGITEREGKETTEFLALLRNLASRGPAILLLDNTTKDGKNYKGRGDKADRIDILYELRDATDFKASGRKPWVQELPPAGEDAWCERASRHNDKTTLRIAFICTKYRGPFPEPFCLEISFENDPWEIRDVTSELEVAVAGAVEERRIDKVARFGMATIALLDKLTQELHDGHPMFKTEAEAFLQKERGLTQTEARKLVADRMGKQWLLESSRNGTGKQSAGRLIPIIGNNDNDKQKPMELGLPEAHVVVDQASSLQQRPSRVHLEIIDYPLDDSIKQPEQSWGEI